MDPDSVDIVIYHAECSDGFGAAFAAWKRLGNRAVYIPQTHASAYTLPAIDGKNVALLDFAYNRKTVEEIVKRAASVVVIDHHKRAMIELDGLRNADLQFDLTHSGAVLAWNYFHPTDEIPKFLRYIEDRDLWAWELPYSKEFSAAFDMIPFDFEEFDRYCDDSVFDDAVQRGSYILAYSRTFIAKMVKRAVRKKLLGYDTLVVNSSHWISEIGNTLARSADIALIWFYDHVTNRYICSLRSAHPDIDVDSIASHFGGGGHPSASGFQLDGKVVIDEIFEHEDK